MNLKSGLHITKKDYRPKHWMARWILIVVGWLVSLSQIALRVIRQGMGGRRACYTLCAAMGLMLAFSSGPSVEQTRVVRVGVYQNKPKIFIDENGQPAGIFIELLDQIAAQEGWDVVYVPCQWAACLQALEEGQIDLMPDVAYSAERATKYDFHKTPVLESWSRVYTSPHTPINKLSDLTGKRVAVLKGSIQQTVFEQLMNGFGYEVTIVPADTFEQAFTLAANGSADAAITNHLFGNYFYQKYGLLKTTIDFDPVALYYVTAHGRNPDLLEAIDRDLNQWIPAPNSPYYTTLGNWTATEPYRVPRYVFWVIGSIMGLLALATGAILLLRRQVAARTRYLEQINAELQESKQRYQTLTSTSPVGIFRTEPNGATTYVNPKWCEISGLAFDSALGDGWLSAVHPDDRERLKEGWQQTVEQEEASFTDYRFVRPDGTVAWVMGQAVPEMNSENKLVGYVGTITDITERKRAEERIKRESDFSTALLDSMPGIFYLYDENLRFLRWNKNFEKISGYTGEEIAKMTPLDFFSEDDKALLAERISTVFRQGFSDVEADFVSKDETKTPYYLTGLKLQLDDTTCLIGIGIDIAAHKALEAENQKLTAQFYQAQKMDSIGQLAGGIAHDFNNLLVPIIGYAELGKVANTPSSKSYTQFEQIREAGTRAASLTRQILAFSRQQMLEMKIVDLNQVIIEFEKMLRRLIGENIYLETYLSPNLPAIKADPGQLEQVLLNLVVNARDAMPNGGRLTIETTRAVLDEAYVSRHVRVQPGLYAQLTVSDTGHGMDAATQERIFEPFFTTKARGSGTGLGLSTVFGIVKQHGGDIWVYSEPGHGAIFKIYLPAAEKLTLTDLPEKSAVESLTGTETVLVVEDEEAVRQLVISTLQSYGYQVMEAGDPAQGLALVAAYQNVIHLLLTDVIMPGMSGRELFRQLVIHRPELKVLYMSGYTDNVIFHHGELDEGVAFLQKPFTIQALLEKVRVVLG